MKAGIMTFHQALNYGAVLQTYALQQALGSIGADSDVIDYTCEKIKKGYDGIIFSRCSRRLEYRMCLHYYIRTKKRQRAFDSFAKRYLKLSRRCDKSNIAMMEDRYDCFITGSDQVFNDVCTDLDRNYFLDFVKDPKKKNSYAASFGFQEIPGQHVETYKTLLGDFGNLSVREEQGVRIVRELLGKRAERHVDPTLTLPPETWERMVAQRPLREKYIFIYTVQNPRKAYAYAEALAEKTGYKIVFLHGIIDTKPVSKEQRGAKHLYALSPDAFLNYIYHAEYVLTNSFHGTVFSIIYKKKFMVELEAWKYNHRAKELLDLAGLAGHDLKPMDISAIEREEDWDAVHERLRTESQRSMDYLESICPR